MTGAYRDLVAAACGAEGVRGLAWCLMANHVHLVLVPATADGLTRALSEAHRRYSRRVNFALTWTGYLWQGRFASYPMDEPHLMAAIRYVERNPVKAGLVERAEDWPWSSARAHVTGEGDGLTDLTASSGLFETWRRMLSDGLEAADAPEDAVWEKHARTGRPLGGEAFLDCPETLTDRTLKAQRPGPKPKVRER